MTDRSLPPARPYTPRGSRAASTLLALGALGGLGSLAACAAEPAPVAVAVSLGTKQCDSGGLQPATLARRLSDAGVRVLSQACGVDGRMRPSVCGAGDGRIAIFEIPAAQLATAQGLGYVRLDTMPDAQREACRP